LRSSCLSEITVLTFYYGIFLWEGNGEGAEQNWRALTESSEEEKEGERLSGRVLDCAMVEVKASRVLKAQLVPGLQEQISPG
jgi:hypothetical protein